MRVVMGAVIPKSISHSPFVLIYLVFQKSKLRNLVSIVLFPTWETFQLGFIWVLHVCPSFGFPFGEGRGSKY